MLKTILKIITFTLLSINIVNADPIDLSGKVKGIDVTFKSSKSLVVGENDFYVTLAKNTQNISDAKVRVKIFMPEMPGMPYMDYKAKGKYKNGKYHMLINFSMSGTWQYKLEWKTSNGKKYRIKGSINL